MPEGGVPFFFFIGNAHPVDLEPTISSSTLLLQEKVLPFQLELIDLKVDYYKNLSMNIFNLPRIINYFYMKHGCQRGRQLK